MRQVSQLYQTAESVVAVAPTGVAACAYLGGRTIHKVLGKGYKAAKGNQKQLSFLVGVKVVLLDEIFMTSSALYTDLNVALQKLKGQDKLPFGGVAIVGLGDPWQLRPVGGASILQTSLKSDSDVNKLFKKTLFVEFQQQMRAQDDVEHTELLKRLRDTSNVYPLKRSNLRKFQTLSADEVRNDPRWFFAPVVVTNNYQRARINETQIQRFAHHNGAPVVRWRNALAQPALLTLTEAHIEFLYTDERYCPELHSLFTVGAPVFLVKNIATCKGLANGTAGALHSIALSPSMTEEQRNDFLHTYSSAVPGTIIDLPVAPHTVNVRLKDLEDRLHELGHQWPEDETLASVLLPPEERYNEHGALKIIVPLRLGTSSDERNHLSLGGLRKVGYHVFDFELAFAMTYHKIQGRTMDNVTLNLQEGGTPRFDLSMVYVGLSRVRKSLDIRLLPLKDSDIASLVKLPQREELADWWQTFIASGSAAPPPPPPPPPLLLLQSPTPPPEPPVRARPKQRYRYRSPQQQRRSSVSPTRISAAAAATATTSNGLQLQHSEMTPQPPSNDSETGNDNTPERRMLRRLRQYEMQEMPVIGDGNCMFRSVSYHLYAGNQNHHAQLRADCVAWMRQHLATYLPADSLFHALSALGYENGTVEQYCDDMARDGEWGDHITLLALAAMLQIEIWILTSVRGGNPVTLIAPLGTEVQAQRRIQLSHWAEEHYNPLRPSAWQNE
jgi:hypothetical protein